MHEAPEWNGNPDSKKVVGTTRVELKIPCQAEFIGVARLMILGVASRTPFSYDEAEDIRLALGEACTSAIDRADRSGLLDTELQINCQIDPDRFTISIHDNLPVTDATSGRPSASPDASIEDQSIGALLMEILVDEIHQESAPETGTTVTMVKKYTGR